MSLVKSTVVIGSCTFLSRIFGFLRDMLIANVIGASWLSDAFFLAFKLPNFFRRLFAEGAFNVAFVPLFAGKLEESGKNVAMRFASEALSVLLVVLLILNAAFLLFMPVLLPLIAPGFTDDPEKFDLTVTLARIAFPYILLISMVSLLGGILNSLRKFAAVALTPVLLNIVLIAALLGLSDYTETPAHALSWGVSIAGCVQCLWLIIACKRADALPSLLLPRITPQIKRLLVLIAPAALGAGVAQINLLIDVILASRFEDGVSYLYYADRITQLPIGVIGVAASTALLPMLSSHLKAKRLDEARNILNQAIWFCLLFTLPATMAILMIPEALITVVFEHGAFDAGDTAEVYPALMAYAAGLPAFILVKLFAPGFYAAEDTRTPFIIATLCVGLNLALNLYLMQYYAHTGLAMATSIAGWVNTLLLGFFLQRRGRLVIDSALMGRFIRIAIACGLLAVALYYANEAIALHTPFGLGLTIAASLLIYAGAAQMVGAASLSDVKKLLRKQ